MIFVSQTVGPLQCQYEVVVTIHLHNTRSFTHASMQPQFADSDTNFECSSCSILESEESIVHNDSKHKLSYQLVLQPELYLSTRLLLPRPLCCATLWSNSLSSDQNPRVLLATEDSLVLIEAHLLLGLLRVQMYRYELTY